MKAVTWCGKHTVNVDSVPDPKILNPRDAIVRITSTAICGSDLHLYDGYIPTMQKGDILGHEFMGEIIELGREVKNLRVGQRVIVPFTIACGNCWFCKHDLWSCCDNSNPNAHLPETAYGHSPSGLFGYSHLTGGYAGGQAQFARVPYADTGLFVVPEGLPDDKALFCTDIFPTGYQAAEQCNIRPGDVIGVWGCGPVAQFVIRSAFLLGAERVVAIDHYEDRLEMAREAGAETLNFDDEYIYEKIQDMTGGRGCDAVIDAVGMEAHGFSPDAVLDRVKTAAFLATDRAHVLRQMIHCCRKGGTASVPGVYGGFIDKFPIGAAFNKGLTFRMGQTHVHKYVPQLFERIQRGDIDPSFVITHKFPIDAAPQAYDTFHHKRDDCIKVVLDPWAEAA